MYKSMLNSIKGFIGNDRNDIEFLVSTAQNRWSQLIVLVYLFKLKCFLSFTKKTPLNILKKINAWINEPRFLSCLEALNVSVDSHIVVVTFPILPNYYSPVLQYCLYLLLTLSTFGFPAIMLFRPAAIKGSIHLCFI